MKSDFKNTFFFLKCSIYIGCLLFESIAFSQQAKVSIKETSFTTYPFSDPSPVPSLAYRPDIYPYFKFEGYSLKPKEQGWKVITLENDFLEITVLPEIGGRVWGAVEKSTGIDFIYKNEVVKFRNIAMRGPWTSGGIEFNFGIIGHAPSTSTPVDYVFFENEDGSVTCVVGAMDLPSRTQWRVKINLPKDRAYFETQGLWYNPESLRQPYYNWMTAAAHTGDDLEFFYPGHLAIQHSGGLLKWPINESGIDISKYKNNAFGSSKSHHMAGSFQNHFGGYFHDQGIGFGHFASYDDMPGKKLWIWDLSRAGGIWEDLLTDKSGQYIEFQAGRLMNQFQPSRYQETPLSKAGFAPYLVDRWTDFWFPVKRIGGISAASEVGAFYVKQELNNLLINFNPFQPISGTMTIKLNGKPQDELLVDLAPMAVFSHKIALNEGLTDIEILLNQQPVFHWNAEDPNKLQRPYDRSLAYPLSKQEQLYYEARQDYYSRNYPAAKSKYEQYLETDPGHQRARIDYAELLMRNANYEEGLKNINLALSNDFYDPQANFVAGAIYRELNQYVDALEAFGWAARSMEFRSSAYTAMAEIHLSTNDFHRAKDYAEKAIEYNVNNIMAYQVLGITQRLSGKNSPAIETYEKILTIDPLNHYARFESHLLQPETISIKVFNERITNEFPYQTYIELAAVYLKYGRNEEAITVLQSGPKHPLVNLWLAFLERNKKDDYFSALLAEPIAFVFPFRKETLEMLTWAVGEVDAWKLKYYLALNLLALDHVEKGQELLLSIHNQPDEPLFYLNRALLLTGNVTFDPKDDLQKALEMDESEWRTWYHLAQYFETKGEYPAQLDLLDKAVKKFQENYVIEMDFARALANMEKYEVAMNVLEKIQVLPYEGAGEGRVIFEYVYLNAALDDMEAGRFDAAKEKIQKSLEWPENLGVGKPFNTNETLQAYLMGMISKKSGKEKAFKASMKEVMNESATAGGRNVMPRMALDLKSMEHLGKVEEADVLWSKILETGVENAIETIGQLTGRQVSSEAMANKSREYLLVGRIIRVTSGF